MSDVAEPGNRRSQWRLHVLVAAVITAGVLCLALPFPLPGTQLEPPAAWRLALVALVLLVGDSTVLQLRFGRDTYTFTWSEAAIIIGLYLVPWPWLSFIAPLAVAAVHAFARRSPVKVAFNAASMAVGATLAQATVAAMTGGRTIHEVGTLFACAVLAVAVCVAFAWNGLSVSAASAM